MWNCTWLNFGEYTMRPGTIVMPGDWGPSESATDQMMMESPTTPQDRRFSVR
jgi:hypothetical protein